MTFMTTPARTAVLVALSVLALYVLHAFRHALLLLYVAAVVAVLFDPLVRRAQQIRVRRHRPGRGAATAIVALLAAGFLVLIGFVVVPPVLANASQLALDWPERSARLLDWLHRTLPFSRGLTAGRVAAWLGHFTGRSPLLTIGATAMDVLTTLLLTIYMLADGPAAFAWLLSLAPQHARPQLESVLRAAARRMQRWVGGQSLLMLTHGVSALLTFWLLGLPYAPALAVFAGVINVIPALGPILTLAAAGLVALVSSPGKLLGIVIFYIAYHNAEGIYLQPRIMASAVGIPGVAIIAALLLGEETAGFIGMALSVPTAVLVAELKKHYAG
jgi:predicted PurR-regulated permease PerM